MIQEHGKGKINYISDEEAAAKRQEAEAQFEGMIAQEMNKLEGRKSPTKMRKLHDDTLIEAGKEVKGELKLDRIVTADLESLITKDGLNQVFMAAWYNGTKYNILDISQWSYNKELMLQAFWQDLINNNFGKTVYFHNWGGYDSILSLSSLLTLGLAGYSFNPILNNGEIMSISVLNSEGKTALVIKDSIRIIPGALGKLTKDWKVETQKDHFPHYFYLNSLKETLSYTGSIPEYQFFEPKRTTQKDYDGMVQEFKIKPWSFLEVSKDYILGDVKALYQIMIKFFETLTSKFPIDPLKVLSAPSTAFKIWRTVQLPKLNQEGLKVYDLAKTLDSRLRIAYCGGIVDVYRPHLIGKGIYYDVNSLYPAAMCRSMPVGLPTLVNLTIKEFLEGEFFGYLEATVLAPSPDTPGGYIGLLPLKVKGRLICPGGTLTGLFFSEELRFALANGYTLVSITTAYSFEKGNNTFKDLINQLNSMKIEAQQNKKILYFTLNKLGMLKLEHIFKEGIFASPKIYYLELENGKRVTKCKGFSGQANLTS